MNKSIHHRCSGAGRLPFYILNHQENDPEQRSDIVDYFDEFFAKDG